MSTQATHGQHQTQQQQQQNLQGKSQKDVRVLLVVSDGSEELEVMTPLDLLRIAGAEVTLACTNTSNDEKMVAKLTRDTRIMCDTSLKEACQRLDDYCAVVIPGGDLGAENLKKSKELTQLLEEKMKDKEFIVAAICAAPCVVLHQQGFLKEGQHATAHPKFEEKMGKIFSKEKVVLTKAESDGATIVTSQGPGTAIDFSLKLIEMLFDDKKCEEVCEKIVYPKRERKA